MTNQASHNPEIEPPLPALIDQAVAQSPLDVAEQQFAATESPDTVRFNRLSKAKQLAALFAGSAVTGAFLEGYGISGSTARGLFHAAAEVSSKAVSTVSEFRGLRVL